MTFFWVSKGLTVIFHTLLVLCLHNLCWLSYDLVYICILVEQTGKGASSHNGIKTVKSQPTWGGKNWLGSTGRHLRWRRLTKLHWSLALLPRPCGLHAQSLCSQWTSILPAEHSVWWQRCYFLWLPWCAECSSIWSLSTQKRCFNWHRKY